MAERIIQCAEMESAKLVRSPLPLADLVYDESSRLSNKEKEGMINILSTILLSKLLILVTRTRPYISTPVPILVKLRSDPARKYWRAIKHIVHYFKNKTGSGTFLRLRYGRIEHEA